MKTLTIFSVLAANDPQTIYDIFSGVRASALDMTASLSSIGVALASLLAAFTLIKISSDIITGRGTTLWQIFRPFIIILLIANLGTLLKGVDGALNFVTMKIMQNAKGDEIEMNTAITRASRAIAAYRSKEPIFNEEAKIQANANQAIADIEQRSAQATDAVNKALEELNKGQGEKFKDKSEVISYPGGKTINVPIPEYNVDLIPGDRVSAYQQKAYNNSYRRDTDKHYSNKVYITNNQTPITLENANEILANIDKAKQSALDQVNSSLTGSRARTKKILDNTAISTQKKNGGDFTTAGNTPWEGLMGYVAGDIDPYCTTQPDIEAAMGDFHGLSTFVNWLANKIYLIMNTWAELTLILLAFLAPFIFAFSVLPFYKDGISSFFARYIQISFWKVCASAVTWASVVVRYSIMKGKIAALDNLYQGNTDQLARISAYDFVTLFISIATLFTMFTIPKVASYIIESSGAAGIHDSAASKGAALAGKPGALVGGAMRKKIFG